VPAKVQIRRIELHRAECLCCWTFEAKRVSDGNDEDKDLIVMGDFNIPKVGDPLFQALTKQCLLIPDALTGLKHRTNLATGLVRGQQVLAVDRREVQR
jgi:hypothetical protein